MASLHEVRATLSTSTKHLTYLMKLGSYSETDEVTMRRTEHKYE